MAAVATANAAVHKIRYSSTGITECAGINSIPGTAPTIAIPPRTATNTEALCFTTIVSFTQSNRGKTMFIAMPKTAVNTSITVGSIKEKCFFKSAYRQH